MRPVFADASYWWGLLSPKDDLHAVASRVSEQLGQRRVVTSEFVLLEVMKLVVARQPLLKGTALTLIEGMRASPNTEVVPASSILFQKACKIYGQYEDKEWDAIDCSSLVIMQERGITEALTNDKHFQQMGFRALLREQAE